MRCTPTPAVPMSGRRTAWWSCRSRASLWWTKRDAPPSSTLPGGSCPTRSGSTRFWRTHRPAPGAARVTRRARGTPWRRRWPGCRMTTCPAMSGSPSARRSKRPLARRGATSGSIGHASPGSLASPGALARPSGVGPRCGRTASAPGRSTGWPSSAAGCRILP
ncbi:hypothetical protein FHS88_003972 [Roseomonas alkaliterrae]|uniref:Uncharacterized protein n=1 Tax=Neoroseomonas alkaliterrae TaxID=1452450 RepID=A0A840Y787_9PROT|nr:hypothetical protein [Neoroseomonas alkaliterrae]